MDQDLSQQISTRNDQGYQTLASVACIDPDKFPAGHYFAHPSFSYNTGDFEDMCLEMSQQVYDSTGAFDTVETLSAAITLEHSLPSTQHQQTYFDRATCSSLGSRNLIQAAGYPSTSTTFMSLTPITANAPAHDVSFESTESPRDEAAERRKYRRRAQNRTAQRAFRARQEEIINESTVKVKELQDNLTFLQSANASLSGTVTNLTAQLLRLQGENAALKQSRLSTMVPIDGLTEDSDNYNEPSFAPQEWRR